MTASASLFDVVAIAPQGEVRSTRVRAASAEEAAQQAQLGGLRVLDVLPVPSARITGLLLASLPSASTRTSLDVGQFAQELGALLDAGLGMVESLATLGAKQTSRFQQTVFRRLADSVTEGLPLSLALSREAAIFPDLLIAAVAAAEHTGDLPTALRSFAENQAALRTLRNRFIGAAIYPAVLLAVATVVVLFLLGVVVPRFALLIESAPHDVPLASRMLLAWGTAVSAHPWVLATALAAIAAGGTLFIAYGQRTRWRLVGLQRLWVVGPLVRTFRQAQFFRTAAMLVGGGIPASRAMTMCGALLTPEDHRGLEGAIVSISEGQPISVALAACGVAGLVAERMLEVAGRTGKLAEALGRIASFQESDLGRALDIAARLIEPALMILIGLVIGGIVVLMYMPIFELASGLQ